MIRGISTGNVQQMIYDTKPLVTVVTPTTGQTVSITNDSIDRVLWLTPAGTLLALTVNLPSEATSVIGQVVRIGTTAAITTLTVAGATNILNTVTTLALNGVVSFVKVAANTWVRIA